MSIKWKVPALPDLARRLPGKGQQEKGKINYVRYDMSPKEEALCFLEGMAFVGLFSFFFYRSMVAVLILSPGIVLFRRRKRQRLTKKRKENLEQQFKETLLCVSANLQAGYSMENAFLESYQDVVRLFGSEGIMVKELLIIRIGLSNGIPLEQLLTDLGNRTGEGEIADFAEVFTIACRTGARWREVMEKTIRVIEEKLEMKEEIATVIHARQLESRIMCIIPFFILCYMSLTSPGYFDVLYHNLAGILIMTGCLALYLVGFLWTEKIVDMG
jgi:tight adherence protein B